MADSRGKTPPPQRYFFRALHAARGVSTWQCFSVLIRWGFSRVGGKRTSGQRTRGDRDVSVAAAMVEERSVGGGGGGSNGGGKNWTAALTRS